MISFACRTGAAFCTLVIAAGTLFIPKVAVAESYDVIFRGGELLDGTGSGPYRADVGVRMGTIAAIGDLGDDTADRIIDATDLTVVPGFIDLHSHADGTGDSSGLRSRDPKRRAAPNLVTQGITTVVVDQDGPRSPEPDPDRLHESPQRLHVARLDDEVRVVRLNRVMHKTVAWAETLAVKERGPYAKTELVGEE